MTLAFTLALALLGRSGYCQGDYDRNGQTDVYDGILFMNDYNAGDLAADFDGDGLLTNRDVIRFAAAWKKCEEGNK